jgi:tRNA (guanine-N7-)-methyltransferase
MLVACAVHSTGICLFYIASKSANRTEQQPMSKRYENNSSPTELMAGDIEYEMGIPIPGVILEKDRWVQTAIKKLPENETLDLKGIFGRVAPLAVDIGCGNGRFAISSAVRRPNWDHLAIDILPAVVRYGTRRGNQRGLSNLRFAVCDGWRLLDEYLQPNSVDEFHIYHPQPFTDPAQSNRRMLTPEFLGLLHSRLKDGGQIFLQSDRREYWDYICQIMGHVFDWQEIQGRWPEDEFGRSRREVLSTERGLTIFRGVGNKRTNLSLEDIQNLCKDLPQPQFQLEREYVKGKRPLRKRPAHSWNRRPKPPKSS